MGKLTDESEGDTLIRREFASVRCVERDAKAPGIVIDRVADLGGPLGTSSGGRIQILDTLPPAEAFMVLAHEYAHELLHHATDRRASRDTRELEAEAVAFVVGQAIGLDVTDAGDYIHLYRGDSTALGQSLDRIQRTASAILGTIDACKAAPCQSV